MAEQTQGAHATSNEQPVVPVSALFEIYEYFDYIHKHFIAHGPYPQDVKEIERQLAQQYNFSCFDLFQAEDFASRRRLWLLHEMGFNDSSFLQQHKFDSQSIFDLMKALICELVATLKDMKAPEGEEQRFADVKSLFENFWRGRHFPASLLRKSASDWDHEII